MDNHESGLPAEQFLRARIIIDLTQPLIPGCFVPLDGQRVSWVFFRYEGVFKFCKKCGCVGHYTGRCNLSTYDAHLLIRRRIRGFEEGGMIVLHSQDRIPLYTNMIKGLTDRFINRNPRIHLNRLHAHHAQSPPTLTTSLHSM